MQLKICGLPYRVIFRADLVDDGETNFQSSTISIRAGMAPERTRDTLIHEIAHAIAEGSGLSYALANQSITRKHIEEVVIRVVVPHVIQLIQDNGKQIWGDNAHNEDKIAETLR